MSNITSKTTNKIITKEQAELLDSIDLSELLPKQKPRVKYRKSKKEQKTVDELQVSIRELAVVNSMLKNALGVVVCSIAKYGSVQLEQEEANLLNYVVDKYL